MNRYSIFQLCTLSIYCKPSAFAEEVSREISSEHAIHYQSIIWIICNFYIKVLCDGWVHPFPFNHSAIRNLYTLDFSKWRLVRKYIYMILRTARRGITLMLSSVNKLFVRGRGKKGGEKKRRRRERKKERVPGLVNVVLQAIIIMWFWTLAVHTLNVLACIAGVLWRLLKLPLPHH